MDRLKILVIEDYTPDVVLIQAYLEEAALTTEFYHTPTLHEGISIVKENPIDIVLLDLSLNDTAGFNTLKKFLQEAPSVPVIVMTGLKNEVVGIQAVRAGAQDFLIKGEFDSRELVRHIRYALQRWRTKFELIKKTKQLEKQKKKSTWFHGVVKFGNWEMNLVDRSMKWEDEMFRIFGFEPNSFSPTLSDYLNYVHLEDREKVDTFFDTVIREASLQKLEHRIIVSGTVIKHIRVHAQVSIDDATDKIMLMGGVQDITDQKRGNETSSQDTAQPIIPIFGNVYPPFYPMVGHKWLDIFQKGLFNISGDKELSEWESFQVAYFENYLQLLKFALLNNAFFKLEEEQVDISKLVSSAKEFASKNQGGDSRIDVQFSKNFPEKLYSDPNWLFLLAYLVFTHPDLDEADSSGLLRFEFITREKLERVFNISIALKINEAHSLKGFSKADLHELLEKSDQRDSILSLMLILEVVQILKWDYVINAEADDLVKIKLSTSISEKQKTPEVKPENTEVKSEITNILIAEDHPINRIKIKNMLSSWPNMIRIKEVENGKDAIDSFNEEKFDVVLMDLKMPIMGGIEATSKIRQRSRVPIIALTNEQNEAEKEECYAVGADAYLEKPLKQDDLFETIQALLL